MDENLKKQAELMAVIDRETAAYKHAFGYREWRSACEVGFSEPQSSVWSWTCHGSNSVPLWVWVCGCQASCMPAWLVHGMWGDFLPRPGSGTGQAGLPCCGCS